METNLILFIGVVIECLVGLKYYILESHTAVDYSWDFY